MTAREAGRHAAPWGSGAGLAFAVAVLAAAFGTAISTLIEHALREMLQSSVAEASGTFRIMATLASTLLIGTSLVVAGIVAHMSFVATVEDRRDTIALRRLVGASARGERRRLLGELSLVGLAGAATGWAIGVLTGWGATALIATVPDGFEFRDAPLVEPFAVVPAVVVALTCVVAASTATRSVLLVRPLEALQRARIDLGLVRGARTPRSAWVLLVVGVLFGLGALGLGFLTPLALPIAFLSGLLVAVGLVAAGPRIAAPLATVIARCAGSDPSARAAVGALKGNPRRVSALVVSLLVGVTVVVTLIVASGSLTTAITTLEADGPERDGLLTLLDGITAVAAALVGFSLILAILGFVAAMGIAVRRRTREIGLLRALGLSRRGVTRMLVIEGLSIALAGAVSGLVLGLAYGWLAGHTMLASVHGVVSTVPAVSWLVPVVVLLGAVIVALLAVAPAGRKAVRISPMAAVVAE